MMKQFFYSALVLLLPLAALAQTGNIEGTVSRRDTGTPLANAEVRLIETNERQTTDENGRFVITDVPEGIYTLVVAVPNVDGTTVTTRTAVTVVAGETVNPKINVEMETYELEGVEVTDKREAKTVSKKSLGSEELTRLPGTGGDVLRALPALPGIGVANDFSGALYIRGGSDEDNLYYFDRVPFGYPYHFGGLVSSVSSEIIDRIDVYAGGYGAEFGIDSQAVIDIYSQDSSSGGLHGKFNLNLLYSEGVLQGDIGDNGYWYAAGRRSYIDLFINSLSFDTGAITAFPRFWDYQLKGGYELGDKHQLSANLFASGDRFAFRQDGEDVDEEFRGDSQFQSGFNGAGIHLRSLLSERLTSFLSLTRSDFLFDIDIGSAFSLNIDAPDYVLREDLTFNVTPKHQLESGIVLALEPGKVTGTFSRIPDEGEDDYDIRFEERQTVDESVRGIRAEGYLQDRFALMPMLSVVFGMRFDYFNRIDEFSIQPRGSILVELPNSSELQFSYGVYNQSPQPWLLSASIGNPDLGASEASHYIMELTQELSADTEIKMAGYYKDFKGLVTSDGEGSYLNQGTGYAQGAEIFLRHRIGERFFGWVSYAYALSKRRDRPEEPYRFYSFDQTHVATLVASYNLSPTWEIGAKWQYRTGNPYTPITGATPGLDPRNGKAIWIPIYAEPNSDRLPPYHRLDLRVSKTFKFSGWQLGVFLELLNAYNRANLLQYNYSTDYKTKEPVNQFPLIPYLGISAAF